LLVNVDASHFQSQNENLDVGRPTLASEYLGADLAYDKLLSKLADHKFVGVSAELRNNILDYYQGRTSPASRLTEKARAESAKLMEQREQLDHLQPETAATP
jgi:hypothetical protein